MEQILSYVTYTPPPPQQIRVFFILPCLVSIDVDYFVSYEDTIVLEVFIGQEKLDLLSKSHLHNLILDWTIDK